MNGSSERKKRNVNRQLKSFRREIDQIENKINSERQAFIKQKQIPKIVMIPRTPC